MKKFRVIGIISASVDLGVYEAETEEEAKKLAYENRNANWHPSLCHHCSREVEIGDVYDTDVEEVTE